MDPRNSYESPHAGATQSQTPRHSSGWARRVVAMAGIATLIGAYVMVHASDALYSDSSIARPASPWAAVMEIGAPISFVLGAVLLASSAFLPRKGILLRGRANRRRITPQLSLITIFRMVATFFVWIVLMRYVWSLELPDFHPNILIFSLSWPFTGLCVRFALIGLKFLFLFPYREDNVGPVLLLAGIGTLIALPLDFVLMVLGVSRGVAVGTSYAVTVAVSCADILLAAVRGVPQAESAETSM